MCGIIQNNKKATTGRLSAEKDRFEERRLSGMKERLNRIRTPKQASWKKTLLFTIIVFLGGAGLGFFQKWIESFALDDTIWWHRVIETLNLNNFFSELPIWLLLALIIAVFSYSPLRAALKVFVFFVAMCVSYHIGSIVFAGFNPSSYMMIWYAITIASPFLAVICWYAKGPGIVSIILDILIISVFTLTCFGIGFVYVTYKGILYLLVFIAAPVVLYKTPKQTLISLPAGFLLAYPLSLIWPLE